MRYKIVLILAIIIFSGCITPSDNVSSNGGEIEIYQGIANKKVNLENLEIVALDYNIYDGVKVSDNVGRNILKINFKLTNVGVNKLEPHPDRFVIILTDGRQIQEILPTDSIFKHLNNKIDLDIKQGQDLFPGASYNIFRYFLVPINFDIKSTKIEVLSGERVEIFR